MSSVVTIGAPCSKDFDDAGRALDIVLAGPHSPSEAVRFLTDGPLCAIWTAPAESIGADPFAIVRALHDTVVQRLCGVSLLLSAPWTTDERSCDEQDVCGEEVSKALLELREIIEDSLTDGVTNAAQTALDTFATVVTQFAPVVRQRLVGELPSLTRSACRVLDHTLAEAFRNISKHSVPHFVAIDISGTPDGLELIVSNDGVAGAVGFGSGVGVRLLSIDAAACGGELTSWGEGEAWTTRLTLPAAA